MSNSDLNEAKQDFTGSGRLLIPQHEQTAIRKIDLRLIALCRKLAMVHVADNDCLGELAWELINKLPDPGKEMRDEVDREFDC